MLTAVAGLLGAAMSLLGTWLYLRDTRRGLTTPHRGSWLVWGVIAVMAAASHGAGGVGWSLVVLTVQAATTVAVLVVAVRRGVGGLTPVNLGMLAIAGLGIAGWTTLTDPMSATACAALADAAGLAVIWSKAWHDPGSETVATYALAAASGLLAVVAVRAWHPHLLLFPVYFFVGNAATASLIGLRRRALDRRVTRPSEPSEPSEPGSARPDRAVVAGRS